MVRDPSMVGSSCAVKSNVAATRRFFGCTIIMNRGIFCAGIFVKLSITSVSCCGPLIMKYSFASVRLIVENHVAKGIAIWTCRAPNIESCLVGCAIM